MAGELMVLGFSISLPLLRNILHFTQGQGRHLVSLRIATQQGVDIVRPDSKWHIWITKFLTNLRFPKI